MDCGLELVGKFDFGSNSKFHFQFQSNSNQSPNLFNLVFYLFEFDLSFDVCFG